MEINVILNQVNDVFRVVFNDDMLVIGYETTAKDIEDWDSLTHIQLVVAIEKLFKIRFTSMEIREFKNVGEMCESIATKIKPA